jgi:putative flippase GtrA
MEASPSVALRKQRAQLVSRYVLFAVIAGAVNIVAQAGTLQLAKLVSYEGPFRLSIAMAVGTVAGLLPKYLLDARWIFDARDRGVRGHARSLPLYTLTSVFTTFIFWGFEYLFDVLGRGSDWRYVGAVIGLAIGYRVKYTLDRDFVFGSARA